MTEQQIRNALATTMRASLADQAAHHNWTYAAVRPLPLPGTRGGGYPNGSPKRSDCSWGVRLNCWWTKEAPDPMRTNFVGSGNSSTICSRLTHLAEPSDLRVGDVVTFGWNGNEHAAQVLETGTDPLLWSDGHQGAPNTYKLSYDRRTHQLLRLPVVGDPPTPLDKLRSATGYWAWMQWKLGEGAWRGYGQSEPTARPNVPKLIPPQWWQKRAAFLLARKRGNPPTT